MGLFFPFLLQKFWTFWAEVVAVNQDGSAYHLPQTLVVQHQVQQEEDCPHPRWQVGLPVSEETPHCPKMPNDRSQTEGCQGCQRKDRPRFPHRRAEDCRQGVEEPRKVNTILFHLPSTYSKFSRSKK